MQKLFHQHYRVTFPSDSCKRGLGKNADLRHCGRPTSHILSGWRDDGCNNALFATYYVFMYEYPASMNIFLYICKSASSKFLMHGNFQRL